MTDPEIDRMMKAIRAAFEECEAPFGRSDGEWQVYLPNDLAGEPAFAARSEAECWDWIWDHARSVAKSIINVEQK